MKVITLHPGLFLGSRLVNYLLSALLQVMVFLGLRLEDKLTLVQE